jgi:DNA-binding NarL/FixJ family response regulator
MAATNCQPALAVCAPVMRFMNNREERRKQPRISILIVDDHPLFRDGLHKALSLEDDLYVIGQCEDGHEALAAARKLLPDVVVLDINLPSMNGLQVARQLKADRGGITVVVLTAYHDSQQVIHAMRAGASAYCPKDITPDELIAVIRDAAHGHYIVHDQRMDEREFDHWLTSNLEAITSPYGLDADEHFVPLSPREMEILQFVVRGLSNKEIATELQISHQTVKNHMTSILKKLNVQDRTQAAVTALRHGWVRIQDDSRSGDSTARQGRI